ncbi:glycosyltransferase family 2 protein [Aquipuribacter hungaricus]|uniref:Glycosyltransferase family 2 protein n=1 Tax=Aquipuribacter hungaricus TaxID=545624 RepID=A0ABV7WMT5_9MICO
MSTSSPPGTSRPPGTPRATVVTIVRGRLDHLARQGWGLAAQDDPDLSWVVVRMGGPDPRPALQGPHPEPVVVDLEVAEGEPLPLAAARNAGIAAATAATVVLLDVDAVPGPTTVRRCADAAEQTGGVVAGPVSYLPAGVPATPDDLPAMPAAGTPHTARPVPADGELLAEDRWELLWTVSMAAPTALLRAVGGFDERYTGYGAEDTDMAMRLRASGAPLHWVGGAWAFHQHHEEVGRRDRVPDIVRNASLFRSVWGWWPMAGWLQDLAADGRVEWDPDGTLLREVGHG